MPETLVYSAEAVLMIVISRRRYCSSVARADRRRAFDGRWREIP